MTAFVVSMLWTGYSEKQNKDYGAVAFGTDQKAKEKQVLFKSEIIAQ